MTNFKYQKLLILFIGLGLVSAGCLGVPRDGTSTSVYKKAENTLNKTSAIQYEGENGKTALEILKTGHTVETKTFSGIGEYVVAINGVRETTGKNFWAFYVNGKQAKVGAGDFKTKNTDKIEWKLEDISAFKN